MLVVLRVLKGSTCAKLKPSICSDEGLVLEKSALKLSINLVDNS